MRSEIWLKNILGELLCSIREATRGCEEKIHSYITEELEKYKPDGYVKKNGINRFLIKRFCNVIFIFRSN